MEFEVPSLLHKEFMRMQENAFQDTYSHWAGCCYGCGPFNEHGLHIKSYWENERSVCRFTPKTYHTAVIGYVYGGLIASLIDCHSTGTAAAAAYRAVGRPMGSEPELRFVTASLHVDYLRPTPIDSELLLTSSIDEITERKVVVTTDLSVGGTICARGRVVAVRAPENMKPPF